jgi:hypothetical protein
VAHRWRASRARWELRHWTPRLIYPVREIMLGSRTISALKWGGAGANGGTDRTRVIATLNLFADLMLSKERRVAGT